MRGSLYVVLSLIVVFGGCAQSKCEASSCEHGGTCVSGDSAAVCVCPPGYSGARCEVDIDDCARNPCFNGGTCTDGVNSFTCACAPGFSGTQCERNVDDCTATACSNGGVCLDGVNDFTCLCPVGFAGETCAVNADDCDPNPCFNGGTCTDAAGGFTCACATGFSGAQCQIDADDCASSPCANAGQCIDGANRFTCVCAAGFSGATCATNLDDCNPNPCFNGGACVDGDDRYTCTCPPGFWGVQCEADVPMLAIPPTPVASNAYVGVPYFLALTRSGGTTAARWRINPGATNAAWLTIDPVTGVLQGGPTMGQLGAVSLTVHVEEPLHPANFAERTLSFSVMTLPASPYDTSFEGVCPVGWTLTGDWQCGAPSIVGPSMAFDGTQCIGTRLAGNYSDLQTFAGSTATSPAITLPSGPNYAVTFRMWVDTEGSTYDGFNLSVVSGSSATVQTAVLPAYPLIIGGQPAWGGHQVAMGWQPVQADLSAYAGQTIRLRFSFQSDSSGNFPGIYLDDLHLVPR